MQMYFDWPFFALLNMNNKYLLSVIERNTTPSVSQSEARKGF